MIPDIFKTRKTCLFLILVTILIACSIQGKAEHAKSKIDPTTLLWYTHPADKWENALPVGNGRLGAMVFGRPDEERIQINEETYWSGGPYNQTHPGGWKHLSSIQKLIFEGQYIKAHKLFGRHLMGYPIEQQKYQSLGNLILKFAAKEPQISGYRHQLDLDQALVSTEYKLDDIHFRREVFVSPVDQVIVIHLEARQPGCLSFDAQLRGCRNQAHSNYATDYFQMDGYGSDGLILTGKSADYLGVQGTIRYEARLKAVPVGGKVKVEDDHLIIQDADSVTLYIAAATNFVSYKDVSGNPHDRVDEVFKKIEGKSYDRIKKDHLQEHRLLFRRLKVDFGSTPNSFLPTDERLKRFDGKNDPNLAALCLQFGRYLLICSSRPETQPANLQGIWNEDMNPSWDSKYTTNINTEMNYWPAEVGNLSECAEPLFRMIEELSDQGQDVAREHYGARGWVFHQNTDLWRVAAPMDGPNWGAFTTGGAWLCTHLWEHYLFTEDKEFLAHYYPFLKGNVTFFLDFLVEHPRYGWLVTNPSTSPENFPGRADNVPFYDEITCWMSQGTTICAGSAIDMQILRDLFSYVARTGEILDVDQDFRQKVLSTRDRLAPIKIGRKGDLQEWLEDWPQKEKSHRHISNLYGLFPGNQISARRTPRLAEAAKVVLDQRGLQGNGWSSAWKMACWARLYQPEKALENFVYAIRNYTFQNLFSICSKALQVDGSFGVAAAIMEMLLQSHEGEINLLPSLPSCWSKGFIEGIIARGGFELEIFWEEGILKEAVITSRSGKTCRVRTGTPVEVLKGSQSILVKEEEGVVSFETSKEEKYRIIPKSAKTP